MVETFKDAMKKLLGNVPEKLKRKKKHTLSRETLTWGKDFGGAVRAHGCRRPPYAWMEQYFKILLFGKHRDCGDRAIFNASTSAACRGCAHRRVEGWADAATAAIYFRDHFINMNEK